MRRSIRATILWTLDQRVKPCLREAQNPPARINIESTQVDFVPLVAANVFARRFQRGITILLPLIALLSGQNSVWAQETTTLPTGKQITPTGSQTDVGSFPANLRLSPDGRYVVVTNTGFREFVSVLRVDDGRIVSQIEIKADRKDGSDKGEGLYYGLAFGPTADGKTPLYVSRGAEDRVSVYALDADGSLTDTGRSLDDPSGVPNFKSPHHVAGVALSADGSRLYAVNNNTGPYTKMKGSLSVLDVAANRIVTKIELPGFPYAIAAMNDGHGADRKVYVTSERDGVVSAVNPTTWKVTANIATGDHPMALALDKAQRRLFVANAGSDTVSVVDTGTDRVVKTLLLRPDEVRGLPGATPTGMALAPDETRLYVTLADMNAVAVVDLPEGTLKGYLPVGWYPTAVVVSPDGKRLFVANAKGVRVRNPNDRPVGLDGALGQYIQNIIEGTVSTIDLPDAETLKRSTEQVLANNRIVSKRWFEKNVMTFLSSRSSAYKAAFQNGQTQKLPQDWGRGGPEGSGLINREGIGGPKGSFRMASPPEKPARAGPTLPGIDHVIYIIKENRTYDQVLGDLPQGNGDSSQCLFPRAVTPNLHALAERFVLLDNFYDCAEVSADGWDWSTSGMISEYTARNAPYNYSGRGRVYDFEGQNNDVPVDLLKIPDVARAPGGYIWDLCVKNHVSLRNYGFYVSFFPPDERDPDGQPLGVYNTPNKRALVGKTDTDYLQFDMSYADSNAWVTYNTPFPNQKKSYGAFNAPSRFAEWKREFDAYVQKRNLPRFMTIRLPRDHTSGTTPNITSPRGMVADNDYAVGEIVEAVSKSPYWKKTALFIIEDDAQNGHDHVDAHRSICFVISPYVQRATIDHRFYNTDSVLRTMELLLGLPPMCQYDAIATPFGCLGTAPDNDAPYTAILPDRAIIAETNKSTAYRAQESARLNFRTPDAVPDAVLNDILWHAIKGAQTPTPPIRRGLSVGQDRKDVDTGNAGRR